MVRLVILTGEAMEDVRQIRGQYIDWSKATWTVERNEFPDFVEVPRTTHLAREALDIPYRAVYGYFFPSPRALRPRPINFYTEIIDRLKAMSGVEGEWGVREIRRAEYKGIEEHGDGPDALTAWSTRFASELARYDEKRNGFEEVEL